MKLAFVYGGQGQQALHMSSDIVEEFDWATNIFKQANEILGYDLLDIVKNDEVKINQTQFTQPALFVSNYIFQEYLVRNNIKPDVVAGLSLGEYNALVMANVLSFEDALKIIKVRSKLMADAYAKGQVKMVAILKADTPLIEKILKDPILENNVAICNYNTNAQVVIGGLSASVEKAMELLKDVGFKKMIELEVSTISHMHLLSDTSKQLHFELGNYQFNKPTIKFINNIAAQYQESDFLNTLSRHISSPTYMAKSIELMLNDGITTFVEIAPKKALSSFINSISSEMNKQVNIYHVFDLDSLNKCIESIGD